MKEIVKYVGGGFFALLISASLVTLAKEWRSKWNDVLDTPDESVLDMNEMEQAYTKARRKNDVSIEFRHLGGLYARKYLQLEYFFRAIDATGEEAEVKVLNVKNLQNGREVPPRYGRYMFPTEGIYEVHLQCRNHVVKIQVPVNAWEGEM